MSYVRSDDAHDNGRISDLRRRLEGEVHVQSGDNTFRIFQDRQDITWGQQWAQRINESIDAVTFLFPVITPGFFKSEACRDELERFLEREKQLQRNDLILPIYYVDTPGLDDPIKRRQDKLASIIADRQYADWRELRFDPLDSPKVRRKLAELAKQVVQALERPSDSTGVIPPSSQPTIDGSEPQQHADVRLNETIDFGSSLAEIAAKFTARMNEFNEIDGVGPDKYLDLAAHVFSCCARSLDILAAKDTTTLENRSFAERMSMRLKRLADYSPDYLKHNPIPKYWMDGTELANELTAHVRHLDRFA